MKLNSLLFHIPAAAIVGSLACLYLTNLVNFPIFADEAIYLHWAKRIYKEGENIFISMYDGKPPLFIWSSILVYSINHDLLLAGRLVSVISVFLTAAITYTLLCLNRLQKQGLITLILTLLSPFIFFHTRLALMDPLHSGLLIIALLLLTLKKPKFPTIKLARFIISGDYIKAFVVGLLMGLSFWAKPPALFLIPLPALHMLLSKKTASGFKKIMITTATILAMIALLRISIWFPSLFSRSQDFTYPISEIFSGNLAHIPSNLTTLSTWMCQYLSLPLIGLMVIGALWGILKRNKTIIILLLAMLLYAAPIIVLGKVIAPRYYLFIGYILLLIASYSISLLPKWLSFFAVLIILVATSRFYITMYFNLNNLSIPAVDQSQYLMDWSSGYGIKDASQYVLDRAKDKKILLLTEGHYGTLPDAVFVLIDGPQDYQNLEVEGVGNPTSPDFYKKISTTSAEEIYYLGNQNRISDQQRQFLHLIQSYPKKDAGPPLELYQFDAQLYQKFGTIH